MNRRRLILASAGGVAATVAVICAAWIYSLGPAPLGKDLEYSHVVLDRDGRLLRAYATIEGRWRLPATEDDVDPRFLKLLFAYEDKRFYSHHGVDPMSLARAAIQFLTSGHIVSGGSTITMQVARLLEPRQHRSFGAKLRQIVRALELEQALSKHEHPRALSDARALRRQSGRHTCGGPGVFRQRAAQIISGRSRVAGGVAAIAGTAPAGPFS